MSEEQILKLLATKHFEDNIIAVHGIARLPDPRAFFRKHGSRIEGQHNASHEIPDRFQVYSDGYSENIYYKLEDNYYILCGEYSHISECYSNYSLDVEVVDLSR